MEAYYNDQASNSMPHFSGHYRQRGSGFSVLAAGIALPLARQIIWPAAKKWKRIASERCPRVIRICNKEEITEASSEECS